MKPFNNIFSNFDSIFNEIIGYGILPTLTSTETETGSDGHGDWKRTIMKTNDGRVQVTYFTRNSQQAKTSPILSLQFELDKAIQTQDFESAVKLRDQIREMKRQESKIMDLEGELNECIKKQHFERAIELRDELKKLRTV